MEIAEYRSLYYMFLMGIYNKLHVNYKDHNEDTSAKYLIGLCLMSCLNQEKALHHLKKVEYQKLYMLINGTIQAAKSHGGVGKHIEGYLPDNATTQEICRALNYAVGGDYETLQRFMEREFRTFLSMAKSISRAAAIEAEAKTPSKLRSVYRDYDNGDYYGYDDDDDYEDDKRSKKDSQYTLDYIRRY